MIIKMSVYYVDQLKTVTWIPPMKSEKQEWIGSYLSIVWLKNLRWIRIEQETSWIPPLTPAILEHVFVLYFVQ